ncbi:MAG: hypothetical protein WCO60_18515 [Verrucomicrobiota bacterium]
MKTTLLLVVPLLMAACATKPKPEVSVRTVSGRMMGSAGVENVRYAETLKAYPLARYVDPNNGRIMHEGHTIYRVESTGKWNLQSNAPSVLPSVVRRDPSKAASPVGDELLMELNRQKQVTQAVLTGSQAVSQKLGELSTNLQQGKQTVEQNTRLEAEAAATKQRLDRLEEELHQQQRPVPPAASTVPNASPGKSDW